MTEPCRFAVEDRVYYDDDHGKAKNFREVRRPYSQTYAWDVQVEWANGHWSWVWESDLTTEAEYHEFCGEEGDS